MWTIQKRDFSRGKWRLLDDSGNDIYAPKMLVHSELGATWVEMPVCGETKQEVVDEVLKALAASLERSEKLASTLRIIQAWAACDPSSPDTRENAMDDIIEKCNSALSKPSDQ